MMLRFCVTNESTEDTFGTTDDLQEAIRIAREVARTGQAGDLVLVESCEGKGIKQFILTSDGTIAENDVEATEPRQQRPSQSIAVVNG